MSIFYAECCHQLVDSDFIVLNHIEGKDYCESCIEEGFEIPTPILKKMKTKRKSIKSSIAEQNARKHTKANRDLSFEILAASFIVLLVSFLCLLNTYRVQSNEMGAIERAFERHLRDEGKTLLQNDEDYIEIIDQHFSQLETGVK